MSSDPLSLSHIARSKLHTSSVSKDRCSLHRWVLLKNSIHSSAPVNAAPINISEINSTDNYDHSDDAIEASPEDDNSFLFPDAGKLVSTSRSGGSEAQWLDTLLKALVDEDEEEDLGAPYVISSATPAEEDDDDDGPLSPLSSPMASSDDLHNQVSFYAADLAAVPYHFSYPQYQSSLLRSYPDVTPPLSPLPALYEDHLPYHDLDYVPDYAMPDTIEDTSDDESDTPSTPSFGRSSASLTLSESRSPPPKARSTSYPNKHDLFLFEADPLPFSYHNSYNTYREY